MNYWMDQIGDIRVESYYNLIRAKNWSKNKIIDDSLLVSKTMTELERAIKGGANVNCYGGFTATIILSDKNHFWGDRDKAIDIMIDSGLNIANIDYSGEGYLHKCASVDIARKLLERGADLNKISADNNSHRPLDSAIDYGNWSVACFYMEQSAKHGPIDTTEKYVNWLINLVQDVYVDHQILDKLIFSLYDIIKHEKKVDNFGILHSVVNYTIHSQMSKNRIVANSVLFLKDELSKVSFSKSMSYIPYMNTTNPKSYQGIYDDSIMGACINGDKMALEYLLQEREIDENYNDKLIKDAKGDGACHNVIRAHAIDCLEILYKHGFDINDKNIEGITAIENLFCDNIPTNSYGYQPDMCLALALDLGADLSACKNRPTLDDKDYLMHTGNIDTEIAHEVCNYIFRSIYSQWDKEEILSHVILARETENIIRAKRVI